MDRKETDIRLLLSRKQGFLLGKDSRFQFVDKPSLEKKLKDLESGDDVYITKPSDFKLPVEETEPPTYYVYVKHMKGQPFSQNAFISSFNSEVVPTILPGIYGVSGVMPTETNYILSELFEPLLTEFSDNLITEF
jgi:hypothetical protein